MSFFSSFFSTFYSVFISVARSLFASPTPGASVLPQPPTRALRFVWHPFYSRRSTTVTTPYAHISSTHPFNSPLQSTYLHTHNSSASHLLLSRCDRSSAHTHSQTHPVFYLVFCAQQRKGSLSSVGGNKRPYMSSMPKDGLARTPAPARVAL